ncbi:VOC family protein [Umezawaea endophytica]|uniref:VOC family protein n=1 Tax=Umezawaea endophytica TaxID=1654476 RepID=A0A9X3ADN4_9PSEU|nr:VOC family protein [Umezawaea endophytica]MCS7476297.1 VOC family protein [Umezawaea endophytica]
MSELTTPYAHGTPAWVEQLTTDLKATKDFYRGLFGWDYETDGYTMALLRGKPVAGLREMPRDALFSVVWTTFLATDDVDESVDLTAEHGGTVLVPVFEMEGPGRGAIVADSTGASFGLWEAGTHIGAYVVNEPGAVVWNELAARDLDRAAEFYREVFDVEVESAPELGYTRFKVEDRAVGGAYAMTGAVPADIPPHWMTYFGVTDVEEAVARVVELGGIAVGEPTDSAFGRFATVGDPLGAPFRVLDVAAG